MSRSRGLFAAGAVMVLLGGIAGAALWPESAVVRRTSALVASTLIAPGEEFTAENTLTVVLEGAVVVPVISGAADVLAGFVAGVEIPAGTVLHQGMVVSVEAAVEAAGRAVVEMPAGVLPLRAVPGSYVQLVEIPSAETSGLLEACGSYLYELSQVSIERTGLPEEVPVVGSAQACEAAEASWSLPERIGVGPEVGGRDCAAEGERDSLATVSERFTRVAEMSGTLAEEAVARAEELMLSEWEQDSEAGPMEALAAISEGAAERALADLELVHSTLGPVSAADAASLVRILLEEAERDRVELEALADAGLSAVTGAVNEARERTVQSAADEVAAVPHRCVEEPALNWPSGRGTIEVQVLAVRGEVAEIGVVVEHVTGILEAVGENRIVGYMVGVGADGESEAGAG